MDYSKLIKRIRDTLLLTQTELAEKLGVSLPTVCRWEKGVFEPTMKMKRKIAELCKENNIKTEEE
jgi:DNA-binding XRE family transcriptional regulator